MYNYLFDTDILIDHLRGYEPAKKFLRKVKDNTDNMLISVITEAEIFSGGKMLDKEEKIKTEIFLELFLVIPLNSEIARYAGEINSKYKIGLADSVIAATSLKNNLILITRNIKHYKSIKNLKIKKPY